MPANYIDVEKRLWEAADQLRANSKLKSSEYSVPVLGLIFLRYADHKFTHAEQELAAAQASSRRRRTIGKLDYQARGVMYLPDAARFSKLLLLPEGADIGGAINDAMRAIEDENEELKAGNVLPKNYKNLDNDILLELLKVLNSVPMDIEGDAFGKIYEYFLGKFAMSEGQKGGEFFTPTAVVKLIVEVIEPFHGRIFDPACGSGGMFVQSAALVEKRKHTNPNNEISIYGQKTGETVRLCRMNLAVHGLSGDIRQGNTYIDARHIYRQIARAHREFTDEQIEFLANIVRLYRGEAPEATNGSKKMLDEKFPEGAYQDVLGLCRVATLAEVEAQGWSLNPGRYVGVAERAAEDFDFAERLEELNEELEVLNVEARELEERIAENVMLLLEGTAE